MLEVAIIEGILIATFVYCLIHYYAKRNVTIFVRGAVFLGWCLGLMILAILPIDLYQASQSSSDDEIHGALRTWWRINYWSVYILCMGIFPFLTSYYSSADFTRKGKICNAVKAMLLLYLIFAIFGVAFVLYLVWKENFKLQDLPGFLIALGNTWGLIQIILFMGYGLVAIPRKLWYASDLELRYKQLLYQVVILNEEVTDSQVNLEFEMDRVYQAEEQVDLDNQNRPHVVYLLEVVKKQENKIFGESRRRMSSRGRKISDVDDDFYKDYRKYKNLVSLHRALKNGIEEMSRNKEMLFDVENEAFFIEDIFASSNKRVITSEFRNPRTGRFADCLNTLQWHWYNKIRGIVLRGLSILFMVLSILIILGELTLATQIPFSLFGLLLKNKPSFFVTELVCFIMLSYMCAVTYIGVFSIRIYSLMALHPRHHTNARSLIQAALILARLCAPLCFNFLFLAKMTDTSGPKTEFVKFMGTMKVVPIFGSSFFTYFPIILVLIVLSNFFNVWSKLCSFFLAKCMRTIGLVNWTYGDSLDMQKLEEGKQLIKKARAKRSNVSVAELETGVTPSRPQSQIFSEIFAALQEDSQESTLLLRDGKSGHLF